MDKPLPEILDAIPPKPPRSKLEPYYDFIRDLRRQSRTYREIAQILKAHVGLRVDHTTIYDFVRLRARQVKAPGRVRELPLRASMNEPLPSEPLAVSAAGLATPFHADGPSDVHIRIEALKQRKQTSKHADRSFHYDEGSPLRLVSDP
jgi:hypothetical protein